jgi:hypothetical protein
MNVEIWTEGAQFPEKEYINGIFVAVYICHSNGLKLHKKYPPGLESFHRGAG